MLDISSYSIWIIEFGCDIEFVPTKNEWIGDISFKLLDWYIGAIVVTGDENICDAAWLAINI